MIKRVKGFTLVEVLVASAIVIMSLGVLLQLFASGLDRNHRAAELAHLLTAQKVIVANLELLNPAQTREGQGIAEGLTYQWSSQVVEHYRRIYQPEAEFPREAALFQLNVQIGRVNGEAYFFSIQQIGWRAL